MAIGIIIAERKIHGPSKIVMPINANFLRNKNVRTISKRTNMYNP
jgi:hypothetical protein